MAEPPVKRQRVDGSGGRSETIYASKVGRAAPRRDFAPRDRRDDRNRNDTRRRSRSRDRRDRSQERDGRNGHDGRRDRSRERGPRGPQRDDRSRSRSPRRNGGLVRTRSPPRGPRADRDKDRRGPTPSNAPPAKATPPLTTKSTVPPVKSETALTTETTNDVKTASSENRERRKNAQKRDNYMDMMDHDEMAKMQAIMGITSFGTTKNTKVPGNQYNYGVRKEKKREYRQYMNRAGGFNRPLSPS